MYEIVRGAHSDNDKRLNFRRWLEQYIFTGQTKGDGANVEHRNAVKLMLPSDLSATYPTDVLNRPETLIKAVSSEISTNAESYPIEEDR